MTAHWYGVTIDCHDPVRLAAFWGALLDLPATSELDEAGWATLGSRTDRSPRIVFQKVPEAKAGKLRLHLDVEVPDIDRGRIRVEQLGGTWGGVRHDYDEGVVLLMHDPEGNEFCLAQYFDPPGIPE